MIPADPSEITAEWLEPFIGPVSGLEVTPIGEGFGFGGTSVRIDHAGGTAVVKFATADRTRREQTFYERCAPTTPIASVPFHGAVTEGDEGVIVLGFVDARQGDVLAGCSADEMLALAAALGHVHSTWWGRDVPGLEPRPRMQLSADRIVAALDRFTAPSEILGRFDGLANRVDEIYDELDRQPKSVTHRDFHLDNVLFAPEPVIIDWQLAAYGPFVVDLARLLIEVRPLDVTAEQADAAIETYLSTLRPEIRPSRAELLDWTEPAFDLALAGFCNWLGADLDDPDDRMVALQEQGFVSVATAIDLVDQLR